MFFLNILLKLVFKIRLIKDKTFNYFNFIIFSIERV